MRYLLDFIWRSPGGYSRAGLFCFQAPKPSHLSFPVQGFSQVLAASALPQSSRVTRRGCGSSSLPWGNLTATARVQSGAGEVEGGA